MLVFSVYLGIKAIIRKILLNAVGGLALMLGVLGIFLPLLPTTPFLLLASACFLRSNEKFHHWIHHHPHLGPIIDNWQQHRAVSAKMKKRGYLLLSFSFIFSFIMLTAWWMKLGLVVGYAILLFCFHRLPILETDHEVDEPRENH